MLIRPIEPHAPYGARLLGDCPRSPLRQRSSASLARKRRVVDEYHRGRLAGHRRAPDDIFEVEMSNPPRANRPHSQCHRSSRHNSMVRTSTSCGAMFKRARPGRTGQFSCHEGTACVGRSNALREPPWSYAARYVRHHPRRSPPARVADRDRSHSAKTGVVREKVDRRFTLPSYE